MELPRVGLNLLGVYQWCPKRYTVRFQRWVKKEKLQVA